MDWFWNWGGECFGYRDGESLFTYFGREAGRFDGEEIYGSNGRYLAEVRRLYGRETSMNGTEIRQLNTEDAAEYQAVFLAALQSAPAAFAADYGRSQRAAPIKSRSGFDARSSSEYLWTDTSVQSQHSCSNLP
jgi:hypothetical protein